MGDPANDPRRRFGLFAALLAVALGLHQLWWDGVEVASLHGVVVLAALVVLGRPGPVPRLVVLLGLEVVAVARDMPGAGSHTLLLAVCAATVLADVAVGVVRTRRLPEPGALWLAVAPFLRAAVVLLYVAAALAKVNTGFLRPRAQLRGGHELRGGLVGPDAARLALARGGRDLRLAGHGVRPGGAPGRPADPERRARARRGLPRRPRPCGQRAVLLAAFAFYVAFLPPGALDRLAAVLPAPPTSRMPSWPVGGRCPPFPLLFPPSERKRRASLSGQNPQARPELRGDRRIAKPAIPKPRNHGIGQLPNSASPRLRKLCRTRDLRMVTRGNSAGDDFTADSKAESACSVYHLKNAALAS